MVMKRDEFLRVVAKNLSGDEIVVPIYTACFDWEVIRPSPLNYTSTGAMGLGSSHALGLAIGHPERKVVLFDGDGSLLMHVQELETIRRHGLNILIVALNDGAYGSEVHKLRAEGLPEAGAVFGRTDLAAIARGFGIGGETIDDLAALPGLIARFAQTGGAAVWDVPVSDRVVSPVIRRAHPKHAW
jgi:thiamine pyrophosphate-dependent acetolactate synthase large subunit-like protein